MCINSGGAFLVWDQMNFQGGKHDLVWIRNQASSMAIGIFVHFIGKLFHC
ncbi:hypothetical protein XNW1_4250001 [Xenorhabdus nematophila str. Websteri]|nr:hypothetical protein XNW1_4250001 [Xenorhabdus nematophila str. Websteri]